MENYVEDLDMFVDIIKGRQPGALLSSRDISKILLLRKNFKMFGKIFYEISVIMHY